MNTTLDIPVRRWLLLLLASFSVGCERGCLASWLGERGVGGATPAATGGKAPSGQGPGLDLSGTDCSDGLLRCADGRIEASRLSHLPATCAAQQSKEKQAGCTCPWEEIGRCPTGCADDHEEVIASPDGGAAQLCRPEIPVARPILATDEGEGSICANEGFSCVNDIVRVCDHVGAPARRLGKCLFGCQMGIQLAGDGEQSGHGAPKNPDGVVAILCRRDHAERR